MTRRRFSKPITCIDLKERRAYRFRSVHEASAHLGIKERCIYESAENGRKVARRYVFKWPRAFNRPFRRNTIKEK